MPTALEILDKANAALEKIGTFHFDGEGQISISEFGALEFDMPFTMTGDFEFPDRSRTEISMTVFFIEVDLETINIGAVSYAKNPVSDEWEISSAPPLPTGDPGSIITSSTADFSELSLVGVESLDGTNVYHLKGLLSSDETVTGQLPTEIWVREDDFLIMQISFEGDLLLEADETEPFFGQDFLGEATMSMTVRLSNFGDPVTIEAPELATTPVPIITDAAYDGVWLGMTDQGDEIAFEIENGALRSISVGFTIPGCEADSPMGAYFGSPEYFVEDGSLSLTLAGLYLMDIEATFTSTSSASGNLDIADSNPCGQGLKTSWTAVPSEFYEPPPSSPEGAANGASTSPTKSLYSLNTYVHPESLWQISYPTGWEIEGPDQNDDPELPIESIYFTSPLDDRYAELSVERLVGWGPVDLKEWSEVELDIVEDIVSSFELTSFLEVEIGGVKAYEAIYFDRFDSSDNASIELYLIEGNSRYIVTGITGLDAWEDSRGLLRAIVNSFRFIEP